MPTVMLRVIQMGSDEAEPMVLVIESNGGAPLKPGMTLQLEQDGCPEALRGELLITRVVYGET